MRLMALLLGLPAAIAPAQEPPVVVSAAPDTVALAVYRAPDRDADDPIDPQAGDRRGYALVTETRTVTIPAGPATLRFEGVAGNIFAETAILTGLPPGTTERNLDADLLSPRTLFDRALGRRVLIRRTDPATGRVREEQATIRSSAAGAAVIQVADGYEGLRCSGLPEALVHPDAPQGLVARPTLSIRTDAARGGRATITLSYLAGGFDWQADYVVTLGTDGRADLFAWVTLASSDVTSFAEAATSVIAGKPRRGSRGVPDLGREDGALRLSCWPTTIEYGRTPLSASAPPAPPAPPPPPPPPRVSTDVVVTAMKRVARQEDLGDLKLYRLPERTTVAARAQKQVAMLVREGVALDTVYVGIVDGEEAGDPRLTLRTRNVAARGLGLPLPAGSVAVFEGAARPLLVGEGHLEDRAIGEEVEIALDADASITARVERLERKARRTRYRLTIANALPRAVAYEARIALDAGSRIAADATLGRRGDARTWAVTVPANGRVVLSYDVRAVQSRSGAPSGKKGR